MLTLHQQMQRQLRRERFYGSRDSLRSASNAGRFRDTSLSIDSRSFLRRSSLFYWRKAYRACSIKRGVRQYAANKLRVRNRASGLLRSDKNTTLNSRVFHCNQVVHT